MGWELDNSFPDKDKVYRNKGSLELDSTLKYHKSWDWLMPVVDKIESLKIDGKIVIPYITIQGFFCGVNKWGVYKNDELVEPIKTWITGGDFIEPISKIDGVFHTVVEFIKWYNKQKL